MTAFTLNIHEFYTDLKEAGFTEKQADVIAKIQGKAATATIEQVKNAELVTKADLADAKFDIIKWIAAIVIGAGVAQIFAIMGLLKLLGKI
jgi:ethanolamine utilization protein EutP (predicted NTPase)